MEIKRFTAVKKVLSVPLGFLILVTSSIAFGMDKIVKPLLEKNESQISKFHHILADSYNGVFEDSPKPIIAAHVKFNLVDPFFLIFKAYVDKDNYQLIFHPKKNIDISPTCSVVNQCSICDQNSAYLKQATESINVDLMALEQTKKIMDALNQAVSKISKDVTLTTDKKYIPPTSFHALMTRIILSIKESSKASAEDLTYLRLLNFNTIDLLENLTIGSIKPLELKKRLTKLFDSNQTIFQEVFTCSSREKKTTTSEKKGESPDRKRSEMPSFTDPSKQKEESKKMFFQHAFPEGE